MHHYPKRLIPGLLLCLCSLGKVASAQSGTSTGSIIGFVTDISGASVPSAQLTVTSETGYRRSVVSAADGSYQALLLPPGNYDITASSKGFATFNRKGLTLSVDQNLRVDLTLEVGDTTTQVEVAGNVTEVDTHSFETGNVVNRQQIDDLPVGGDRYLVTVATSPGVIPAQQHIGVITNPYAGWLFGYDSQGAGAQNNATDYQVDSSSTRQGIWGGSPILPTSLSISEVKVVRNQCNAEYGTGGSVANGDAKL